MNNRKQCDHLMNIIYNTQEEIASKFRQIFKQIIPNIRKTVLNILPYILIGMLNSESVVASDISKVLKDSFSKVQHDSVVKRIKRFYKNKLFNPYDFYDKIIRFVINNYKKKHSDKRVHIVFDHMYSKDNYTIFMITMRIGKQGIPLWFRSFKGLKCPEAFEEKLLKEGISYVSSLFNNDYDLIFLADRWFGSISLIDHIASLGHTFCIRIKKNYKLFIYDKREKQNIWKSFYDLKAYQYKSKIFYNIPITEDEYKVNIAVSKNHNIKDPWIIITNGEPTRAIKDYGYRYGAIETVFKNQKSNGFYLENTVNASLKYFETEYMMACLGVLFLTILGADFSKNTKCYKNTVIKTHKNDKGKKIRILSLFNTGLTLFKRAFNSSVYIRTSIKFILYDI